MLHQVDVTSELSHSWWFAHVQSTSASCSIFINSTRSSCGQIQCYTKNYTLIVLLYINIYTFINIVLTMEGCQKRGTSFMRRVARKSVFVSSWRPVVVDTRLCCANPCISTIQTASSRNDFSSFRKGLWLSGIKEGHIFIIWFADLKVRIQKIVFSHCHVLETSTSRRCCW